MNRMIGLVALTMIFGVVARAEVIGLTANKDVKIASGQKSITIEEAVKPGTAEIFRICQINFNPMNFKRTINKGDEFIFDTTTAHTVKINPFTKAKLEFRLAFGTKVPETITSIEQFKLWIASLGGVKLKKNFPGQAIPALSFTLESKKTSNVLSVKCITGQDVSVEDAVSMITSKSSGFFTPREAF